MAAVHLGTAVHLTASYFSRCSLLAERIHKRFSAHAALPCAKAHLFPFPTEIKSVLTMCCPRLTEMEVMKTEVFF
ncbi:hypothetical protein chiPu_0015412 [Chiloscyllium punctatum]|uniref:Uncharacterized protein n=1 Tax=Chiloscyllium punctatum TaxID=137246 RepID=A0A401T2P4_CHIPU|nr:hypothetical protein [Chiloscyllium punctatum]